MMENSTSGDTSTMGGADRLLRDELDRVSGRYRRLLLWIGLAGCWLVLAAGAAAVLTWARLTGRAVPGLVLVLMLALPLVLVPMLLSALRMVRNPIWVARRLERRYMDLDARLLAAIEQLPAEEARPLGYLQQTVIGEAVEHAKTHRWERLVAGWKLRSAQVGQWATLALFVLIAGMIVSDMRRRPSETSWWTGGIADRGDGYDVKVEPEDTSIERGTSLLVLARFPKRLPAEVQLIYRDAAGKEQQMQMSKSLDDPMFAGRVPAVSSDLTYAVRYGDDETRWYKVSVFDYPDLKQADVRLKFPEYTQAPEKLVEDTRSVTAVEGTKATLTFRLNKPVADARLVPDAARTAANAREVADAGPVELAVDPNDPTVYSVSLDMTRSQRYRLHLRDAENRANKDKPDLVLNVTPNRPPDVKLAFPGRDIDVSPLQEMNVRAQVWDDFGIRRVGMNYQIAGGETKDVVLAEGIGAKEKREVAHLVSLEQLDAEPDQLLSYHLWAEDVAADGSVRRVAGDMFFAEVRPYEEIFRQGEQPPGGEQQQQQQQQGSQNAQQAEQLAEAQKQIILATWKVMTRETLAAPTEQFVPDVKTIGESQASTREQAGAMEERLRDERSKKFLQNVLKHMDEAVGHLTDATDGPQIKSMAPALAAEQAAYAELLKLRAREHEVVRGQQRGGQQSRSAGQQRRQQQLDQLDLSSEENRYETERQANAPQESAEQRETRQVLNRLRELAQRQEDLNRQMKELQLALEEARTEAQREELRRQLQRLRDQQQQNLRDTDELRDRMDRPENQQRMSDARQQLEESRENVRRASEALEEGKVPEAAAAGARAGEQLNNLRDEFRKRTAGQFNEAMDQMRRDARELDQKQQDLSQQLAGEGGPGEQQQQEQRKTLRDSGERGQIAEGLQQQKERLEKLMEDMKRTVEEAENAEPLLSKQLYDTARQVKQQQPERALDQTRQMLERGFVEEARQTETEAGKAITRLREGVEEAAESVLGDEAEALRRARNELDALSQELEREMRRRGGIGAEDDPTTRPASGGEQLAQNDARPQDGQQGGRQQQREGEQPGEQGSEQSESAQARGGSQQGEQQQGGQQQEGQQQGQGGQGGEPREGQQQADAQGSEPGEREGSRPSERDGQPTRQARAGGGLRQQGGGDGRDRRGDTEDAQDLQRLLNGQSGPGGNEELGPITGGGFRDWSDRLREVEEMVGDPRLRAEAARIRERARDLRAEFNRHSKEPNWDLVRDFVSRPLVELRDKVAEELLRRQGTEALVPIDREPVPPEFAEQVRRYYERLGSGTR